jgi:hypothetical protein
MNGASPATLCELKLLLLVCIQLAHLILFDRDHIPAGASDTRGSRDHRSVFMAAAKKEA